MAERGGELSEDGLTRHVIEFDPRNPARYRFSAAAMSDEAAEMAASTALTPIPWPDGLAPTPVAPTASADDPVPAADVLIVTYTIAEAYALADVFTPGVPITRWVPYRHGWDALRTHVKQGAPSLERGQAALWYQATVGGRTVLVVKSELHPSTDGIELPIRLLWQQLIAEAAPTLIITTGTAGAVGAEVLLGDVVVAQTLRWDCSKTFQHEPWAQASYTGTGSLNTSRFAEITADLLPVNGRRLPDPARDPQVWSGPEITTLTTDFFAFDDAADRYGLRSYDSDAHAVEMDDAALALTLHDQADPPVWVSVRNASDPQVAGASLEQERKTAAAIYEKYGYITSIGSLITSWALLTPQ